MTRDEVRGQVFLALREVAPEVDPTRIEGDVPFREQLDLDSVDWLRFLVDLDRRLSVSILEADYGRLETLDDLLGYLLGALEGRPA